MTRPWNNRTVVFLDRDGTINRNYKEGPVYKLDLFELLPGAADAIQRLNALDLKVLVATNQGGINHKDRDFDWDEYRRIEARMRATLKGEANAVIDEVFVCHHADYENCACRKPKIGLFEKARERHEFDPARSFIVGDSTADIVAGRRFGLQTVLVTSGWQQGIAKRLKDEGQSPDAITKDLAEAVDYIVTKLEKDYATTS